jgi:hypothetical protein
MARTVEPTLEMEGCRNSPIQIPGPFFCASAYALDNIDWQIFFRTQSLVAIGFQSPAILDNEFRRVSRHATWDVQLSNGPVELLVHVPRVFNLDGVFDRFSSFHGVHLGRRTA